MSCNQPGLPGEVKASLDYRIRPGILSKEQKRKDIPCAPQNRRSSHSPKPSARPSTILGFCFILKKRLDVEGTQPEHAWSYPFLNSTVSMGTVFLSLGCEAGAYQT